MLLKQGISFILLNSYNISIINTTMDIRVMGSVKYFLMNFPSTLSKHSMFIFITIGPLAKFSFCFPNVLYITRTRMYVLIYRELSWVSISGTTLNFQSFQTAFCCKSCSSTKRIEEQTSFFLKWFFSPTLIMFG